MKKRKPGIDRAGYVYIYGGEGSYKIGRTTNIQRRLKELPPLPFRAELIHTIETDDAAMLETHLHRRFKAQRLNGEWFRLSDDDLTAIKQTGCILAAELLALREAERQPRRQARQPARPQTPRPPIAIPTGPALFFRLGLYLEELKAAQDALPAKERRKVPTMTELAREAGISKTNFSKLVRGKVRAIRFSVGRSLLDSFHRRGFATTPADLLGYIDGDD
jgi:AraC-like DNA-binding protein